MLMIRLQRTGRRNDPAYRISVLEKARAAKTGRVVDALGSYNPKTKATTVDEARVKEWIAKGAQPTDTVKNLLIAKGVLTGPKADSFPSSARKKAAAKAAEAAKAAAEAAAAAKAAAGAPAPVAEASAEPAPVEAPAATEAKAPAAEPEVAEAPAAEEAAAPAEEK